MKCLNKYQKSSLRVYNTTEQTLASGNNIFFSTLGYQSGVSIDFDSSSNAINIVSPGLYYITVDATITSTTVNTELTIQINKNGNAITGASAATLIGTAGDYAAISTSAIISVGNLCPYTDAKVPITITITGTTPVVDNVNLNIFKLA